MGIHVKDRFTTPTSGGWADCMLNFSFVHGDTTHHVMELQIQHTQMLVVRKEGKAHDRYNSFRSAFELLEAVGREPKDSYEEMEADVSPMERMERQNIAMQQQMSEMKSAMQQQQQQQMSEMKNAMQQQMSEMKNVMQQQQQQQMSEMKSVMQQQMSEMMSEM